MALATGEVECCVLRLDFDRRLKLEFHGSQITSDAGLLAFRELDDVLGLSQMGTNILTDTRTGRNSGHGLAAQFRQSVFGRLAGYETFNDADRLGYDPAMRFIVGGRAVTAAAASIRAIAAMLSHFAPPHAPANRRTASDHPLNGAKYRIPTAQSWIGSGPGWTRDEIRRFQAFELSPVALSFRHGGRIDRLTGGMSVEWESLRVQPLCGAAATGRKARKCRPLRFNSVPHRLP